MARPSDSLRLTPEEARWWWDTIRTHKEIYRPLHKLWANLIRIYDLDVEVPGAEGNTVKISRFYPIMRQILAGAAFNYPKVFIQADEGTVEGASEVLEQAAGDAIQIAEVRPVVQQCLFNAAFCSVGWMKFYYNPPGDESTSPYVVGDSMAEDFPAVDAVNPFHLMVDKLTRAHRFGSARFCIETIFTPLELFREDPRYERVEKIKPTVPARDDLGGFELDIVGDATSFEDMDHVLEVMSQGKYVMLYEIHDRLKKRILSFVEGEEMPVETAYHPFGNVEEVFDTDPLGRQILAGFRRSPGYLVRHGFPYHPIRLDLHVTQFYPKPPLFYVRDMQRIIMKSVTRREDLLERFKRIILAPKAELQMDPTLAGSIKSADDGDVIGVRNRADWQPLDWGTPPVDQLGLEADMRQYESQILRIDSGDASAASTPATNRSLDQIPTTLNREWIKANVVEAYRTVVENFFSIMGDPRYFPDDFVVSLGDEEKQVKFTALTREFFRVKYKLSIHADSLEPFVAQMEEDRMALWFDRVMALPETNRGEVLLRFHKAFRQPNPEKLLSLSPDVDAIKAAQLETVGFLMRGMDPGVRPGEKHRIHLQQHQQLPQFPQFAQLPRELQELAIQATKQHVESHMQMMAQEVGGGTGAPSRPGGSQPNRDGKVLLGPDRFIRTVQSNAQRVAQVATQESPKGLGIGGGPGGEA